MTFQVFHDLYEPWLTCVFFLLFEESDSGFDMGLNCYVEFCQVFIILLGPYNYCSVENNDRTNQIHRFLL